MCILDLRPRINLCRRTRSQEWACGLPQGTDLVNVCTDLAVARATRDVMESLLLEPTECMSAPIPIGLSATYLAMS